MAEFNERKNAGRKKIGQVDQFSIFANKITNRQDPLIDRYGETYAAVYGAKGDKEWGEEWDPKDVAESLREDLFSREGINPLLVSLEDSEGRLTGFAFAYGMELDNFGEHEAAFSLQSDSEKRDRVLGEIKEVLSQDEISKIMYVKEMGVTVEARGGIEKLYLMYKAMLEEGKKQGASHMVFWTSKDKKLYPLVRAIGAKKLCEVKDDDNNAYLSIDISKSWPLFQQPPEAIAQLINQFLGETNR